MIRQRQTEASERGKPKPAPEPEPYSGPDTATTGRPATDEISGETTVAGAGMVRFPGGGILAGRKRTEEKTARPKGRATGHRYCTVAYQPPGPRATPTAIGTRCPQ